MNLYLRALKYVKAYWVRALAALVCTAIASGCTAYLPWVIKDMVDQVLRDKDTAMLNYIVISIVVVFIIRGISYVTNDVSALQSAMVENVVEMFTESVILIVSIAMMLYLDWKLFLVTFATFPVVLFFIDSFGKRIRKSGSRIQEAAADITSVLQEVASSPRVIKSFVRESYEVERFDKENMNNFRANMKYAQLSSTLTPTIEFVAAVGVSVILWYGGNSVINGSITAGSLVAFLTYAVNISNPIKRLSRVIGNVASLLPRFYDVTTGSITIDGEDIRKVTLNSLREQVGIVPQETVLFNGSVYDNILYGRLDATREEVEAAAKAANAHDFIMQLPNGYETMLGDRGMNISGGQRQRISIARAILKNPQILILDEATSALDTESERVVQEALDRLMVGRTSFVIAHRLSTIKNADKIMVLEKGQLIEQGNHDELMAMDGLYAHLYKIQYRSKEAK